MATEKSDWFKNDRVLESFSKEAEHSHQAPNIKIKKKRISSVIFMTVILTTRNHTLSWLIIMPLYHGF